MYKIAIVDDNKFDLFRMNNFVTENPEFDSTQMEISTYPSGVDFLEENRENVDLLLIDMQMQTLGGFETAREMRKLNNTAVICFCSAVITPQTEHFEVLPYRYILKTSEASKITQTVTEVLLEMKRRKQQKTIELVSDGVAFLVPTQDILYLEKTKHGTLVTLSPKSPLYKTDCNLVSRQKLSELAEELYDEGFAIPHSSYLVNLRKIISVSGDSLVMENESIISISRACKEKFHHEFSKYFNKKYRRGQ